MNALGSARKEQCACASATWLGLGLGLGSSKRPPGGEHVYCAPDARTSRHCRGLVALDAELRQHLSQLLHALLFLFLFCARQNTASSPSGRHGCMSQLQAPCFQSKTRLRGSTLSSIRRFYPMGSAGPDNVTSTVGQVQLLSRPSPYSDSRGLLHISLICCTPWTTRRDCAPSSTAAALLGARPRLPQPPRQRLPPAGPSALRRWAAAPPPPPPPSRLHMITT